MFTLFLYGITLQEVKQAKLVSRNVRVDKMSKVVAFSSGGKDSMHALYLALHNGINVDYLLFVKNGSKAHRLNSWLLELVSETLEIPAVTTDKGMPSIRKSLQKLEANMVISGVMLTPEHMDWYHEICNPIHVKHYAPLWGKNPIAALTEIENLGFQTIIIEVDESMGSRKSWIGKKIDKPLIQEMEKLEKEQEPRVVRVPPKMQKTWGKGTMLIATALLVDAEIRKVKKGQLVTVTQIMKKLARDFRADSTCPMTTGTFLRIAADGIVLSTSKD